MKKYNGIRLFSLVIAFLLSNNSSIYSQHTVIVDDETNQLINDATISCEDNKVFLITDKDGKFLKKELINCNSFKISHVSYHDYQSGINTIVDTNSIDTIRLVVAINELPEVKFIAIRSINNIIKKARIIYEHYYLRSDYVGEYSALEYLKSAADSQAYIEIQEGNFYVARESIKGLNGEMYLFPRIALLQNKIIRSNSPSRFRMKFYNIYNHQHVGVGISHIDELLSMEKHFRKNGPLVNKKFEYEFKGYTDNGNMEIEFRSKNKRGIFKLGLLTLNSNTLKCTSFKLIFDENSYRKTHWTRETNDISRKGIYTFNYGDYNDRLYIISANLRAESKHGLEEIYIKLEPRKFGNYLISDNNFWLIARFGNPHFQYPKNTQNFATKIKSNLGINLEIGFNLLRQGSIYNSNRTPPILPLDLNSNIKSTIESINNKVDK